MDRSLAEIFEDESPRDGDEVVEDATETPEVEAEAANDTGAEEAEAESETSQHAADAEQKEPEEAASETASDESDQGPPIPRAALLDERSKRQKAEEEARRNAQELAELRGRYQAYSEILQKQQPQSQKPKEPEVSPEDEFFKDPIGYYEKRFEERLNERVGGVEQSMAETRFELGQEMMRAVREDYDEAEAAFTEFVFQEKERGNLDIIRQFSAHKNPAQFAYEKGKQLLRVKNFNSLDDYEAHMREKIREELEEEYRLKSAEADAAKVSPSSAGARSAGITQVQVGTTPMDKLFPQ